MNSYILSRQWFAFAFENPSKVKPIHGSIYFWIIELANRLGWPAEFGNPGSQCMAACGIASYNTYKKAFDDLVEFGFIKINQKSKNQYQSCIIALSIIDKAPYKALDKALAEHLTKHLQSTIQSTDSINKPLNQEPSNLKPLNTPPQLFENNSEPLKAKNESPKEKGSAQKEKGGKHLFRNSPYYDKEQFIAAFPPGQYGDIDLHFYYGAVLDWSESNGALKLDWIATARGFMRRDSQEGKLKRIGSQPSRQASKTQERVDVMQDVMAKRKYDENGNRIKDAA